MIQRFWGTHSPRKSGDMGIDGYSYMVHDPIQVKQSERVGRNVVDNFETAMERAGKAKGYIVGFSFTRGAKEEVMRVRDRLDIQLVTVKERCSPQSPSAVVRSSRSLHPLSSFRFHLHVRHSLGRPLKS